MKAMTGRRAARTALMVVAAGLLAATTAGASAHATTKPARGLASHCGSLANISGSTHIGRFAGIIRPSVIGCGDIGTSNPAIGKPPLILHGGKMMSTKATGHLVITPIFWAPKSHPMNSTYRGIIDMYLSDVAHSSLQNTNVFSIPPEYHGSNGTILKGVVFGKPIVDTSNLPASACTVAGTDHSGIYADNSGYNACLDDAQVNGETTRVVAAHHLPVNLAHIYVLYLPKHVESCFKPGTTTTTANQCTINHQPSAAYCAYHSQAHNGTVYANMPFPIYKSPAGFTCSSDKNFGTVESPNGNPDADTEVSPTSHEIIEAMTDPDTRTGWFDKVGFEIGDECAYVFGATHGTTGKLYNQTLGKHHYLTQEEFSNKDFSVTKKGCVQGANQVA